MTDPLVIMERIVSEQMEPSGVRPQTVDALRTALEAQRDELARLQAPSIEQALEISRLYRERDTLHNELAQKDESYIWLESKHHNRMLENEALRARIARLETGAVLAIQSLRDGRNAGGTGLLVASGLQDIVDEHPHQSAAAIKAEALREAANDLEAIIRKNEDDGHLHDSTGVWDAITYLRTEADCIEADNG